MQASLGQDRSGEDVWNVATWKSDISSKVSFIRQNLKKQANNRPAAWKHALNIQKSYFTTVLKRSNRFDLTEEDIDNVDVIVEIVDEFIFNGGKDFTAMQELHLLEIIRSHFQANDDDVNRCLQFAAMFNLSPHDEMKEYRCKMLGKLVSMSVALDCSKILECVAVWIMKHRSSFQDILDLIQAIIYDYCILVPTSLAALERMVNHSSLLASQFLTAVTLLYPMYKAPSQDEEMSTENLEKRKSCLPPFSLLTLVADWVASQPGISLTPYPQHLGMLPNCRAANQDMETPAPAGPANKLPLTPILGLIRWSILGTLCFLSQRQTKLSPDQHKEIKLVFSKLQFGVLETLLTAKKQREEKEQDSEIEPGEVMEEELDYRSLVTIHNLQEICMELLDISKELPCEDALESRDSLMILAVDRLAQIIQVAKSTDCLSGKISEFSSTYKNLPHTRLLNLVLQSR
ncbi:uncharacterized protein C7orf26 homolog [Dendronephthya gigantea]|uniref:uncharacterized protein C7orf26 homolog n=1 Tax=Dendronephthya gigantea TaxID=151771 RepID=UPI00106D46AB|nr:uncharacterized protein C7orf26 homolog [Dendronephthya gigantea]